MTRDEILGELSSAMQEMFEVEAADVTPTSHLIEDLGLDSIDAIDMAVRLQELTGTRVEEAELKALRTIEDVVDLVEKTLAARG